MSKNQRQRRTGDGNLTSTRSVPRPAGDDTGSRFARRVTVPLASPPQRVLRGDGEFRTPSSRRADASPARRMRSFWHLLRFAANPAPRAMRRGAAFFQNPLTYLSLSAANQIRYCVRRKVRRQVLFAKRRAGYSGSAKKRHWQRSQSSSWRC